jgi:sulfopropanediol 3-dehydrogenase
MAEQLKAGSPPTAQDERVRRDVSEMLLRIERGGEAVVREYSQALDGWNPPSFVVDPRASADEVDPELREHIAFALDQVRTFAAAQRTGLQDLRAWRRCPGSCSGTGTSRSARSGPTCPAGATRCWPPRS